MEVSVLGVESAKLEMSIQEPTTLKLTTKDNCLGFCDKESVPQACIESALFCYQGFFIPYLWR